MYQNEPFGPAYAIMVLIVFTQKYSFKVRVQLSSGDKVIKFSLGLHLLSHFGYARSHTCSSGETVSS